MKKSKTYSHLLLEETFVSQVLTLLELPPDHSENHHCSHMNPLNERCIAVVQTCCSLKVKAELNFQIRFTDQSMKSESCGANLAWFRIQLVMQTKNCHSSLVMVLFDKATLALCHVTLLNSLSILLPPSYCY